MASLITFFTHKFFKVLLVLYMGLFILIWLISSPVAKHFITPILAEQKLQLSDEASIRFNPFLMRITLSDINLSHTEDDKKETVFALDKLRVQVDLWQLAFDKIVLSTFSLNQGKLKVVIHDNYMVIAGIKIPHSSTEATKTAVDKQEPLDEPVTDFPYPLILPDFLLSQFTIEITINSQQKTQAHEIYIKELALNQVKATQSNQAVNLTLIALLDKTHFALTADTNLTLGKGDINSTITLKNYPIENFTHYAEQLTELNGALSFNSQQKITLTDTGINVQVQDATLHVENLLAGLVQQHLSLKSFKYNINNLALNLQDSVISHLVGKSSLKLTDAAFNDNVSKSKIAAFKQLDLADINFTLNGEPGINITDIVLDGFLFSNKATNNDSAAQKTINQMNALAEDVGISIPVEGLIKLPPVMRLNKLTVSNLNINEKSIAINSIIFDTLTGDIIIDENKKLANLINLDDKSDEGSTTESITESVVTEDVVNIKAESASSVSIESNDNFIFSLKELRFINNNSFGFTDLSVEPIYQRTVFLDTLKVGALSNSKDKQQERTPFTLIGRSNKYANFNIDGYIQPFAPLPSYHAKGDFKEFSLPAISSYMKAATGIEVKTGQLNTALNLTLTGDNLDGNIVILLQALETILVDKKEAGSLISQGALPLNMAVGMLKDSDGNVELDVPLSGSTSDPKFGLSSIVTLITKKAIMSATQDYLMTTFVPYANIVSMAITAGEYALKLRFDDLAYQAKQIEPDDQQSTYLTTFIALMKDKEDTRVTICAVSTPADIGLPLGVSVTNKAAIKRLIDMGEKRENAFKDYLIKEGKINSSRILFCKPIIDSDEGAIPRIKIST